MAKQGTTRAGPSDALVLCGGRAKRLGAIGDRAPKCLLEVQGKPILFHQLEHYEEAGVSDVYLALGHLGSAVRDAVSRRGGRARYHFLDASGAGTGGAILRGIDAVPPDRFALWISMGDILCRPRLEDMWSEFSGRRARAAILGVRVPEPSEYGVLVYDADRWLTDFKEKSVKEGPALVDAGFYLFGRHFLEEFKHRKKLSLEYEVFPTASRVLVVEHAAFWWDIGTIGRLIAARRALPSRSRRSYR